MSKRWLRAAIGLAVSTASIWLIARDVNLSDVARELGEAQPFPLVGAAGLLLVATLIRGWRWQVMLAPLMAVTYWRTFGCMAVGYLINNVAPLRAGELARVYLAHRLSGGSRTSILATLALERVLDGLFLVAALFGLVYWLAVPAWARQAGLLGAAFFAVAAAVLALATSRRLLSFLDGSVAARLPGGLAPRLIDLYRRFGEGARAMRRPRSALLLVSLTAATWVFEAGATYLVLGAVGLSLPAAAPLLLVVAVALAGVIPSGPSAVGTYEFLAVSVLTVFSVEQATALAAAALLHGMAFAITNVLGLLSLAAASRWSTRPRGIPLTARSEPVSGSSTASGR